MLTQDGSMPGARASRARYREITTGPRCSWPYRGGTAEHPVICRLGEQPITCFRVDEPKRPTARAPDAEAVPVDESVRETFELAQRLGEVRVGRDGLPIAWDLVHLLRRDGFLEDALEQQPGEDEDERDRHLIPPSDAGDRDERGQGPMVRCRTQSPRSAESGALVWRTALLRISNGAVEEPGIITEVHGEQQRDGRDQFRRHTGRSRCRRSAPRTRHRTPERREQRHLPTCIDGARCGAFQQPPVGDEDAQIHA